MGNNGIEMMQIGRMVRSLNDSTTSPEVDADLHNGSDHHGHGIHLASINLAYIESKETWSGLGRWGCVTSCFYNNTN